MAQQGVPPRRSPREPESERRGGSGRPDRPDKPRRGERPGWQQHDPFEPDTDSDIPPWAGPGSYPARPGGSRSRAPARRGSGQGPYADRGYADPYAEAGRRPGGSAGAAYADAGRAEAAYAGPGYADAGYPDAGYADAGYARRDDLEHTGYPGEGDPARYRDDTGPRGPRQGSPDQVSTGQNAAAQDAAERESAGRGVPPPAGRGRFAGRRGRAAATRLRKSRRRVYRWAGIAIVLVVLAAGGVALFGRSRPVPSPWVTTLQAGEYKSVPSACSAVSPAVLSRYLPGTARTRTVSLSGSTDSQCTYTIDQQPAFLVLQLAAQAYQPFAAAGRNGSATANARDGFAAARQQLARPPKRSPLPPALITPLTGLGQQAFTAIQHEHVSGIATDVVTIVIRERNVIVTVSLSGQEAGHGFGPVPDATLIAGARAAAADVLAQAKAQPTA